MCSFPNNADHYAITANDELLIQYDYSILIASTATNSKRVCCSISLHAKCAQFKLRP